MGKVLIHLSGFLFLYLLVSTQASNSDGRNLRKRNKNGDRSSIRGTFFAQGSPKTTESINDEEVKITEEPQQSTSYRKEEEEEIVQSDKRPNIILIITDDQDIELGSMDYMPETLSYFRNQGVEFRHGYTTTPMCCPSRSSLLTSLYVHNHEVYTNNDNCSSVSWREKFEKKTFAAFLWSSGYHTAYIGKYLNRYDGNHIPYGWDEWIGLVQNSRFYNYTLNINGRKVRHGFNYEKDYYPDSVSRDALSFLTRMGKREGDEKHKPFLLVVSFPSPHGPEDSAPQYSQMFFNETPHHTPSYNFAPNEDKQWILRVTEKMTPQLKDFTNLLMTKRLQTLQSVDASVSSMFKRLRESALSESTLIFYTSDHGYHAGQFGLVKGKSMPYEFDIRVPFFFSAPKSLFRFEEEKILEPVLNIDIGATFLDLANIPIPDDMDGKSLLPLLKRHANNYPKEGEFKWRNTFLIESSGRREIPNKNGKKKQKPRDPQFTNDTISFANSSRRVRGRNRKEFGRNLETAPNQEGIELEEEEGNDKKRRRKKEKFDEEAGEENETVRIENLCFLHPHPCHPGQRKYCRKEKGRFRFRKCRFETDFIIFDSEYKNGSKKCICHRKKRTTLEFDYDFDWDIERRKIDEEIDILKGQIEALRNKRREMRRKFTANFTRLAHEKKTRINGNSSSVRGIKKDEILIDGIDYEEEYDEKNKFGGSEEEEEEGEEDFALFKFSEEEEDEEVKKRCDCRREREREERKRRKLLSKERKRIKFLKRINDPLIRHQAETCGSEEKMNCFWHDNAHWRTPPLWDKGSFCFCMNSNNNSYSCLRSVNGTHNYLYCLFLTGFKMYFDLHSDPYQLRNTIGNLPAASEDWIIGELERLKRCKGSGECGNQLQTKNSEMEPNIWRQIFARWPRKKKRGGRRRHHGT